MWLVFYYDVRCLPVAMENVSVIGRLHKQGPYIFTKRIQVCITLASSRYPLCESLPVYMFHRERPMSGNRDFPVETGEILALTVLQFLKRSYLVLNVELHVRIIAVDLDYEFDGQDVLNSVEAPLERPNVLVLR